jgi:hypothetical protein
MDLRKQVATADPAALPHPDHDNGRDSPLQPRLRRLPLLGADGGIGGPLAAPSVLIPHALLPHLLDVEC